MVGYTESLTDPSYEDQILTYPPVGNYGVPAQPTKADLLTLPAEFESSRIHVSALIIGYYLEDFSHFLAKSSIGVPALFGVDTRALTKKIREKGFHAWQGSRILWRPKIEPPPLQWTP